jgi:mRNA-degrading endonuclease toxin of MazEF toxin-antitoxin module
MNENVPPDQSNEFDIWNKKKKEIEHKIPVADLFCSERQIWWCSLGKNIGSEENGKHELFERPVIIFRKFGKRMMWVIPLTTQEKNSKSGGYYTFELNGIIRAAHITQTRPISIKRLIRYVDTISYEDFQSIRKKIAEII